MAETESNIEDEVNETSSDEEADNAAENAVAVEEHQTGRDNSDEMDKSDNEWSDSASVSSDSSSSESDNGDVIASHEGEGEVDSDPESSQRIENASVHPSFPMCWENVGKKVVTRHPTPDAKNTYINMALGYLAVNRVNTTTRDWKSHALYLKLSMYQSTHSFPTQLTSVDFEIEWKW